MTVESSSSILLCKVLHSLVSVTLNNVIVPLRQELLRCPQNAEILLLEIQDAENKTYEYLAQLISVVCNASEVEASVILKEYPNSETCFKCLGISDASCQGLVRTRCIGFLQLLDMPDEEVNNLLLSYGDCTEDVEHVLTGLAKIRGNIDLIESAVAFDDDTRNLIKLVVRLTNEQEEFCSTEGPFSHAGSLLPNSLTVPQKNQSTREDYADKGTLHPATANKGPESEYRRLPAGYSEYDSPMGRPAALSTSAQASVSSLRAPSARETSRLLPPYVSGSHSFGHVSAMTHFPWDFDHNALNGGQSVPNTPIWNDKAATSLSPGIYMTERYCVTPEDATSPIHANSLNCGREHQSRQPGTPPPKHRLKLPFPLHRSSSHESNLTNRLTPPPCNAYVHQLSRDNQRLTPHGMIAIPFEYGPAAVGNGPLHNSGTMSPNTSWKSAHTVHSGALPKTVVHDIGGDGYVSRRGNLNILEARSYGSVGRLPSDIRFQKRILYPSITGTNLDLDVPVASYNFVGSSNGATFVLSRNGFMHRFETESKIGNLVKGTPCAVCSNRMNFRLQHCLHCNIKVHRSCLPHTRELRCVPSGQAVEATDSKGSPGAVHKVQTSAFSGNQTGLRPTYSTPAFQGSESTSISSCTSSAPGSPFGVGASLLSTHQQIPQVVEGSTSLPPPLHSPTYSTAAPCSSSLTVGGSSRLASPAGAHPSAVSGSNSRVHSPHHAGYPSIRFDFPATNQPSKDLVQAPYSAPQDMPGGSHLVSTQSSAESEQTVVDTLLRRFDSMDSQDDGGNLARANSISVTLKDWDIPMENLIIKDVIGHGTFGTVHRAKWHGEVAVKFIDIDPEDGDGSARLEAFKQEVALLHKTRHENLVLFMGACMKPPDLAIVTQLSQGETLFYQLHYRDTAIPINRTINIAIQIAKGMGYLHAKGIVHRDLKSRNIFLEPNSRVVIGDFGVFNCVQLYKKARWGSYLSIPPFWLCYVAPEVIQSLKSSFTSASNPSELPFSFSSDVFAFGTVWYELLTNEYPFKGSPAESAVYLCGRGIKPNIRIPGPKDFKEILVQCWAYSPHRRPEFTTLVKMLDHLPKLHRSPSYPVKPTPGFTSSSHDPLFV